MATQFEVLCALMAGRAYQTNRAQENWFPIPSGWREFLHVPNATYPTTSGFEVVSFQSTTNPNEIVIAFAGTDGLWTADQFANFGLTTGVGANQLNQAVDYYLAVKAQNPDAAVTFTGHSLGGYLAAAVKQQYGTAVTDAYLYNAPGVLGPIGNILSLFGLTGVPSANVWNLRSSDGISVIAGLGSAIGVRVDVLIEPAMNSHSIVLLTDALKVSRGGTAINSAWRQAA